MTTAADLVEETRRHLYSGQMEEVNRVSGAVGAADTSITLKYALGSIARGSIIAIDLEEIMVWETSGQVATVVQRGVNGSTAATHSDLSLVTVRPRFSSFRILKEINNDLKDLCSPIHGLWAIQTVILTYNAAVRGYDLTGVTSNMLGIAEVRYDTPGPDKAWPLITSFSIDRAMPTAVTDFPSGTAIVLNQAAYPGRRIRVAYKTTFSSFTTLADDTLAVAGLSSFMEDLPPLGAAIRLVASRDVKRTFMESQGEPRRAEEVPSGSITQITRGLVALRDQRILAEATRLIAQYPWMN